MGEYNYVLHHKLGITNHTDMLSRQPDYPVVNQQANKQLFKNVVFTNTIQVQEIDQIIIKGQEQHAAKIEQLCEKHNLMLCEEMWQQAGHIIVVGNNKLKQGVISLYHKFSLAGHPGG